MTNVAKTPNETKAVSVAKQKNGKTTPVVVVSKGSAKDEALINEIENSLQSETFKLDENIQKLQLKKEEVTNVSQLLSYWKDANRAIGLLEAEQVNAEVHVSVRNEHGVVSLKSTKIQTVKAVIELLTESSKERMKGFISER